MNQKRFQTKIPRKAKILISVLWVLFVGVTANTTIMARTPSPPIFKCDYNFEIIDTPKLNVPFEVVFRWTPRGDFSHSKNIPDSAMLMCDMGNVRYISGDSLWTGYLKEGQACELRAIYKIVEPNVARFNGIIIAQQALGLNRSRANNPELGLRAIKDCHLVITRIDDGTKPVESDITGIRNKGGDSISIQPFSSEKLNFGLPPVTVKESGMTPLIGNVGPPRINNADTIIVRIPRSSILERLPLSLSALRIYRIICPDDVSSIEIDAANVAHFVKISNNAVIIDRPKKECTLTIVLDNSLYQLPVEIVR